MMGRRDGPLMRYGSHSMRTNGIALAIATGVVLGFLFAFLYPRSQTRPLVKFDSQDDSTNSEPSERLAFLKSEFAVASAKNYELKKQVRELNEKLQLAKQGKEKAGPFSTVKAVRTNPTVIPDESVNPRLAKILEQVSQKHELIVVLANSQVKDMLEVWFTSIKRVGVTNYLVVALDDNIAKFCEANGVPFYRKDPEEMGGESYWKTGGHHPISGLKYRVLREFLMLGYSILLSDVDVVYLQNPFDHLYRDSDIEGMSDGHDNSTAYGHNAVFDDSTMGWARYTHTMRIWAYTSGFVYIRPTIPSIELLDRVTSRLTKEDACDQAVFNEELFYPSYPGYNALHASKRSMDFYLFMNSKILFKKVRKTASLSKVRPVVVHMNFHRDKLARMNAVLDYYLNGKQDALRNFPDGSN